MIFIRDFFNKTNAPFQLERNIEIQIDDTDRMSAHFRFEKLTEDLEEAITVPGPGTPIDEEKPISKK